MIVCDQCRRTSMCEADGECTISWLIREQRIPALCHDCGERSPAALVIDSEGARHLCRGCAA